MLRRRSLRIAALVAGILAFLVVSLLLARWLSAENAERSAITDLLKAQARGDVAGMLRELDGCTGGCAATTRATAARLHGRGELQIVALDSATSHALTSRTANTRVVWRIPGRLPTVQCVEVRRKGSVLAGMSVTLLSLSQPIARMSAC